MQFISHWLLIKSVWGVTTNKIEWKLSYLEELSELTFSLIFWGALDECLRALIISHVVVSAGQHPFLVFAAPTFWPSHPYSAIGHFYNLYPNDFIQHLIRCNYEMKKNWWGVTLFRTEASLSPSLILVRLRPLDHCGSTFYAKV